MILSSNLDYFFQLDFQLVFWGSPAIDLYYILYLVASDEVREKNRDDLIKFYHQEFTQTLEKLGLMSKIPTLHEIYLELLKNQFIGKVNIIHIIKYG